MKENITPGVPAGTLITIGTDFGDIQKPIEKIKPGDLLKTFDMEDYDGAHHEQNTSTYVKIRKVSKQHATKLVKIKYSDGDTEDYNVKELLKHIVSMKKGVLKLLLL